MTGLKTVVRKELKCFIGSGKSIFIIYAVITAMWSVALLFECADASAGGAGADVGNGLRIWFVFFAVIVSANFSGTVFISERVNGSLEVLITSGLSRGAVLFGKMIFVIAAASVLGVLCVAMAAVWDFFNVFGYYAYVLRAIGMNNALIYLSVVFLNVAASAYFSVRMANPRFLHFINLFMTGALLAITLSFDPTESILPAVFLIVGILFTLLARREFAGERIVRPINF